VALTSDEDLHALIEDLETEVEADYVNSQKTSILDYILINQSERKRLRVAVAPQFNEPQRVVRAPMPWSESKAESARVLESTLFVPSPISLGLLGVWRDNFHEVRFIDTGKLSANAPSPLTAIASAIETDARLARVILEETWLGEAAAVILDNTEEWSALLGDGTSIVGFTQLEHLFQSIATLMSNELRDSVSESLDDLRQLFSRYDAGNKYDNEYTDFMFNSPQLIKIELTVMSEEAELTFSPRWEEVRSSIQDAVRNIVGAARGIARVEPKIFPGMTQEVLLLRSANVEDSAVSSQPSCAQHTHVCPTQHFVCVCARATICSKPIWATHSIRRAHCS
jgi:hypothetical protein